MRICPVSKIEVGKTQEKPIGEVESLVIYKDTVWVTYRSGELDIIKLGEDDAVVSYDDEKGENK